MRRHKNFLVLLGSLLFVTGATDVVRAGDAQTARTLRVTIGGEMHLSMVGRNKEIFAAALGDAMAGAPGSPLVSTMGSGTGGDVFFDPRITLDLNFELAEAVTAFVQLETQFGETSGRYGGANPHDRDLEAEQAYVRWEGAFGDVVPGLTLQFGIQDFRKDFGGQDKYFLVDVSHSENPFGNPAAGAGDVGTPQSPSSGAIGFQEAAGAWMRYDLDSTYLDIFYFTISETLRKNSDDVLFGASLERSSENVGFGATMLVLQNDGASYLFTGGGGGFIKLADTAQLYGEAYGQGGRYAKNGGTGTTINVKGAFAAYGGVRLELPFLESLRAYVDASYWEVSGDDNANNSSTDNFVSLEANNDTLILEDSYYGLDIDTNYRAGKVRAGFSPSKQVTIEALWGIFSLQDNNGRADNSVSNHDRLGNEADLTLRYRATDYLTFNLGGGVLFDAKALGTQQEIWIAVVQAIIQF
ncbi:MAG: alginate export family protein [Planctomycetota bacterium]